MSSGLYSGASGLALGVGLYQRVAGLWSGAPGLITGDAASLYLNFLAGAPLDSRITFTRGTNATLVDSTGKITYAPANLLTYSEQFDNAAWSKANSTVTANATAAPDGTTTADKLVESATNNIHNATQSITALSPASNSYMVSSYVKAGERSYVTLGLSDVSVGSRYAVAVFNLDTGATMTTGAQGTGYAVSNATAVAVGNGWYRCSVYCTAGTTVSFLAAAVGVNKSGVITGTTAGGFESYAGDGTSGIFVWGAQLEPVTSQTTPATYVATTSARYYGPRFDYDPVTLAAKGLLIEEARTNLTLYSEQFDNVLWVKGGAAITANTTTSPDGTANADSLIEDTSTGDHRTYQAVTVIAATAYAYSVYIKPNGRTLVNLTVAGAGEATYNISTGVVTNTALGTAEIQAAGNGWYRCIIKFTSAVTSYNAQIRLVSTGITTSYTGNGTSGIFLYGAQFETGAFATSYIPTVASTVTRSADNASMTGTNFSSWYNQTQGTFVAGADTAQAAANRILEASGGASARVVDLLVAVGPFLQMYNGTTSFNASGSVTLNTPFKAVGAYKTANYGLALNGGTVAANTDALVNTANALQIGRFSSSILYLNGHIRFITYYNTRLPNATLQALTA